MEGTETVWIAPRSLNRSSLPGGKEEVEERRMDEKKCTGDERKRTRRKKQVEEVPTSAFAEGDGVDAWRRFYANILYTHGHVFKAVLEGIRDQGDGRGGGGGGEGGAVLFHCTGECIHILHPSSFIFSLCFFVPKKNPLTGIPSLFS